MTEDIDKPGLISFPKIGESALGFISVMESGVHLPFKTERVFWTYYTPESVVRGRHAHHNTNQVLVAVSGRIIVTTEELDGTINTYILDHPQTGVYIPRYVWHTMQYSHSAVQLVFASMKYDEKDYIRSYDDFKQIGIKSR